MDSESEWWVSIHGALSLSSLSFSSSWCWLTSHISFISYHKPAPFHVLPAFNLPFSLGNGMAPVADGRFGIVDRWYVEGCDWWYGDVLKHSRRDMYDGQRQNTVCHSIAYTILQSLERCHIVNNLNKVLLRRSHSIISYLSMIFAVYIIEHKQSF